MIPLTCFLIRVRYEDLPATPAPARRVWTSLTRRVSWRPARIVRPAAAASLHGA